MSTRTDPGCLRPDVVRRSSSAVCPEIDIRTRIGRGCPCLTDFTKSASYQSSHRLTDRQIMTGERGEYC